MTDKLFPCDEQRRVELGAYLRRWRMRLTPEQLGVKRTSDKIAYPKMEDVARKAHISKAMYQKMEQGRYRSLSLPILEQVLHALHVSHHEKMFAMNLSGLLAPLNHVPCTAQITPELQRMLDYYEPKPAYAMNRYWDMIGGNRSARLVYPMLFRFEHPGCWSGFERNIVYTMFMDPIMVDWIVDWEIHARRIVHELRITYAEHRDDQSFARLIAYLKEHHARFQTWWDEPDLRVKTFTKKEMNHGQVGRLVFEQVPQNQYPDVTVVFLAPQDMETEEKLRQL